MANTVTTTVDATPLSATVQLCDFDTVSILAKIKTQSGEEECITIHHNLTPAEKTAFCAWLDAIIATEL